MSEDTPAQAGSEGGWICEIRKNRLVAIGDRRPELGPRGFVWERSVFAHRIGLEFVVGTARVPSCWYFRTVRTVWKKELVPLGRVLIMSRRPREGAFCVFLCKQIEKTVKVAS